ISLAQKIELQPKLVEKAPGEPKRSKPALETSTKSLTTTPTFQPPPPSPRVPTVDASAVKKGNNPYAKPLSDICYRYKQSGHHSNECPKRRQIALVKGSENKSTEHSEEDEVVDQVYADDLGGNVLV
ncbi:hypothetical protein MKW92_039425, partial [Papaver armeniacum]